MRYAIYTKQGLGEQKSTKMRLLMTHRLIKYPLRIPYDILVKVDKFIYSSDFVILDCEMMLKKPIIIGRLSLQPGNLWWFLKKGNRRF